MISSESEMVVLTGFEPRLKTSSFQRAWRTPLQGGISQRLATFSAVETSLPPVSAVTYERLEYLLRKSGLSPEEVGVIKDTDYRFPSDDDT
jgi:hypothetical protein